MAIAPRCYLTGLGTALTSFSPALTGWTNAGAGVTGTAPASGDLVVLFSAVNVASDTFSQTAGTTWADLSDGPQNNSGTSGLTTMIVGRVWAGTETAPTFAWGTTARGTWALIALTPDTGLTVAIDVLSAVQADTTGATSHTAPSAAASGSDLSVLFYGLATSANSASSISFTAPTSWTAPVVVSQSGTASFVSIEEIIAYRQSQTGTVAPGAATTTVSTVANMYHLLVSQVPPLVPFRPHRMPLGA